MQSQHSEHPAPEQYLCYNWWPTFTHPYQPKPTVYMKVHSLCYTLYRFGHRYNDLWACLVGSVVKNPPASAGDRGSIPGSGRSPEEAMTTQSSILAWRIPWTEEPGGLQSTGLQRAGHDWATKQQQQKQHDDFYPPLSMLQIVPKHPLCSACEFLLPAPWQPLIFWLSPHRHTLLYCPFILQVLYI